MCPNSSTNETTKNTKNAKIVTQYVSAANAKKDIVWNVNKFKRIQNNSTAQILYFSI